MTTERKKKGDNPDVEFSILPIKIVKLGQISGPNLKVKIKVIKKKKLEAI